MPRYFFDTYANGDLVIDDDGQECRDVAQVRMEAMRALPAIAKDEVPKDGDRQAYTVLVKNESGLSIYSATLTFAGLWLNHE